MASPSAWPAKRRNFGQPEVKIGIMPGYGGTHASPAGGKGRAFFTTHSTGDVIGADEAYRIGLVNEIVASASLIARAETLLKQISAKLPWA